MQNYFSNPSPQWQDKTATRSQASPRNKHRAWPVGRAAKKLPKSAFHVSVLAPGHCGASDPSAASRDVQRHEVNSPHRGIASSFCLLSVDLKHPFISLHASKLLWAPALKEASVSIQKTDSKSQRTKKRSGIFKEIKESALHMFQFLLAT